MEEGNAENLRDAPLPTLALIEAIDRAGPPPDRRALGAPSRRCRTGERDGARGRASPATAPPGK